MPPPNVSWADQMQQVLANGRDTAARLAIRAQLHPQAGEIVEHLTTDYPWLPPGVVASMAQTGVDPSSPLVTAVARMAYQQKAQQGDWLETGDRILPKQAPEPEPVAPEALPQSPPVAPEPDSAAGNASLLSPTPQPIPPVSPGAPPA